MVQPHRALATGVYLASIAGTLAVAFTVREQQMQNSLLVAPASSTFSCSSGSSYSCSTIELEQSDYLHVTAAAQQLWTEGSTSSSHCSWLAWHRALSNSSSKWHLDSQHISCICSCKACTGLASTCKSNSSIAPASAATAQNVGTPNSSPQDHKDCQHTHMNESR